MAARLMNPGTGIPNLDSIINPPKTKRVKRFLASPEIFSGFFTGKAGDRWIRFLGIEGIDDPENIRLLSTHFSNERNSFEFIIEHPSFPEIPNHCRPPSISLNVEEAEEQEVKEQGVEMRRIRFRKDQANVPASGVWIRGETPPLMSLLLLRDEMGIIKQGLFQPAPSSPKYQMIFIPDGSANNPDRHQRYEVEHFNLPFLLLNDLAQPLEKRYPTHQEGSPE